VPKNVEKKAKKKKSKQEKGSPLLNEKRSSSKRRQHKLGAEKLSPSPTERRDHPKEMRNLGSLEPENSTKPGRKTTVGVSWTYREPL